MNRDKKWLLREFRKLTFELQNGYTKVKAVDILPLLDQLDETKKAVVPQFVADEFDYDKNPYWEVEEARIVAHILRCAFGDEAKPSVFLDWVRENPEDYVMAVKNGYEIEKEKLYYIPLGIKRYGQSSIYLFKSSKGIDIDWSPIRHIKSEKYAHSYRFTESEIKSIIPNYWQFAEPVE